MALKLMSVKVIGSITTGASAIVGGGFGINAAVNGGANVSHEINETHQTTHTQARHATYKPYQYFVPENATPSLKTYLTNTEDFVANNTTTSSFMLAKVVSTTSDVNFQGDNFVCTVPALPRQIEKELPCKLRLISTNLFDNNVAKILVSELSEITNIETESPKNSYIILEVTADVQQLKSFVNKEISVKLHGSTWLLVQFDKFLYKQESTIDDKKIVVLVPLKKNIISFLIERNKVANLFQGTDEPIFFNCSLQENSKDDSNFNRKNNDDSCRIIKIDTPTSDGNTLITFDEIKKSSSPLTKEDIKTSTNSKYIKLDVDTNKFYGTDIFNHLEKNIIISSENNGQKTTVTVKAANAIHNNEIKGKINWLIVKNKESTKTIQITPNSDACSADDTEPTAWTKTLCTVHLIEGQQPTTKGEFEKLTVNSTEQKGAVQIREGDFYVFQYPKKDNCDKLKINDPFYLFARSGVNTSYKKHEFEITAFLMDNPTKENKTLLLSDISF